MQDVNTENTKKQQSLFSGSSHFNEDRPVNNYSFIGIRPLSGGGERLGVEEAGAWEESPP